MHGNDGEFGGGNEGGGKEAGQETGKEPGGDGQAGNEGGGGGRADGGHDDPATLPAEGGVIGGGGAGGNAAGAAGGAGAEGGGAPAQPRVDLEQCIAEYIGVDVDDDPDGSKEAAAKTVAARTAASALRARAAELHLPERALTEDVITYLFERPSRDDPVPGFDNSVRELLDGIVDDLRLIRTQIDAYRALDPAMVDYLQHAYDDYLSHIDTRDIKQGFLRMAAPKAQQGPRAVSVQVGQTRVTSGPPVYLQRSPRVEDGVNAFVDLGLGRAQVHSRSIVASDAIFIVGVNVTVDPGVGNGWEVGIVQYAKGSREATYGAAGKVVRRFDRMQDGATRWFSRSGQAVRPGEQIFVCASDRPFWAVPSQMKGTALSSFAIADEFETYVVVKTPQNEYTCLYQIEWKFVVDDNGARYEVVAITPDGKPITFTGNGNTTTQQDKWVQA